MTEPTTLLAFIPQFVTHQSGSVLLQFPLPGAIIAVGGFAEKSVVKFFAGSPGQALAADPRAAHTLGWVSSGVFPALPVRFAVMERA